MKILLQRQTFQFCQKYAVSYSKGDFLAEAHPEIAGVMKELADKIIDLKESGQKSKFISGKLEKVDYISTPVSVNEHKVKNEIVIISGKGGTGKTTLTAALAAMRPGSVFFDADVDASNLPILLKSEPLTSRLFTSGAKAEIVKDKCIKCGKSASLCRFGAIKLGSNGYFEVIESACEGCGLCKLVCPYDAIKMNPGNTGFVYTAESKYGKLAHAFLNIGEENSGKLVTQVRNQALNMAITEHVSKVIGDGPPGTGCPVIASVTGCRVALIVTELVRYS
ncbi:MAG: hypothetical protein GY750_10205 [Lentisphaerae bacterium]|nr:hypothetical protein [Lentisphaerota bacterium]MCP4101782.1 hypothetical protein [Lentisphaerota bacterium]